MKSTGIVRRVDELGRVVIPIELRRVMGISEKDPIEIFTEGNKIILKKFETSCIFCEATDDIQLYKDRHVCGNCMKEMAKKI